MRKISQKNNKTFIDNVCKGLIEIGANKIYDLFPDHISFMLETSVGKLRLRVETDNVHCYTVFSKFEDVESAKQKFDCNPFSGKYNVHLGCENDVESVIDFIITKYENTL